MREFFTTTFAIKRIQRFWCLRLFHSKKPVGFRYFIGFTKRTPYKSTNDKLVQNRKRSTQIPPSISNGFALCISKIKIFYLESSYDYREKICNEFHHDTVSQWEMKVFLVNRPTTKTTFTHFVFILDWLTRLIILVLLFYVALLKTERVPAQFTLQIMRTYMRSFFALDTISNQFESVLYYQ